MNTNERIKYLRQLIGLSQRAFADKVGISQNKLARIEVEKISPQLSILNNISLLFNINIDWLKSGTGSIFNDGTNTYKSNVTTLPYNPNLLESIVIIIDEIAKDLPAHKKAKVISYYYEHYRQSSATADYEVIKNEIQSSIKFVNELLEGKNEPN